VIPSQAGMSMSCYDHGDANAAADGVIQMMMMILLTMMMLMMMMMMVMVMVMLIT
jgi:hypothetical protein